MKEYKFINEVLKKVQINGIGPGTIILVVVPILSIYLSSMILPKEYIGVGIFIGMISGFSLACLLWSYNIAKWRIWAFENTKKSDWISLNQREEIQKLIWNDGSIFEKIGIRSKGDAQQLKIINTEIEHGGNVKPGKGSSETPSSVEYYYKRKEKRLNAFLLVLFIAFGLYLIYLGGVLIGALSIVITFYHIDLNKIKDIGKNEVQISIMDEGIYIKKFKKHGIVNWNNTQNISVNTKDGNLELGIIKEEALYEIVINLKDYEIGDYDEFSRKVSAYLKRSLK